MRMRGALAGVFLGMICGSGFAQSQGEMNQTAAADFHKADQKLTAVYEKAAAALQDETLAKFRAAEDAWVAFRDLEGQSEAYAGAQTGSMAPLLRATTKQELSEERMRDLARKPGSPGAAGNAEDFNAADAKLNGLYKNTLAACDDDGKEALMNAEKAWIRFRDAEVDSRTHSPHEPAGIDPRGHPAGTDEAENQSAGSDAEAAVKGNP